MNTQYTATEINQKRQLLQNYHPAQEALTVLEQHQGQLDEAFDQLWSQTHESETVTFEKGEKRSLWKVTLEVLRTEVCGDEGFRSKILNLIKIR
jgi:DNA repair ATPase RecN